jgi:homoserine dehydrogenase
MSAAKLRIGLLGCGTVGRGVVQLVERERDRIRERHDIELAIERILVRDLTKVRPGVDRRLLTTRATEVIDAAHCDLIVEVVGGVHCAGAYVRRAIANGRHVVTANKALLAECGRDLFAAAGRRGVSIGFEASVCGGIPVIRAIRDGLAADTIDEVRGILNGTSNYILTRIESEGLSFDDALRLAQERGFAEADPSLDVDGEDAAQKLRILASLAFGEPIVRGSIAGIRGITRDDVDRARDRGFVIRHVATARRTAGGIELRVAPEELPANDPLACVRDEFNAVVIRARATGEITLIGKGAGAGPTAAAVVADVMATHTGQGRRTPAAAGTFAE